MHRPVVLVAGDVSAADVLRDAGLRVIEVAGGPDTLTRIEQDSPDALVLDLDNPRLAALELCQRLARGARFIPSLLITSRGGVAARVDALRAGAQDVLARPYDDLELRARVEVLVRTRRRLDEARRALPVPGGQRDRLTGLADQRHLTQRLEQELDRAAAESEPLSVMAIDLDGFGEIVGRFGRSVGDRLLVAVARALVRVCRAEDVIARAGGDEFVLILPRIHLSGAVTVAERVWREIRQTCVLESGSPIACLASVGVASFPGKGVDAATDLLRFAHAALARAKSEGRGHVCLYQHHGYLMQPRP